MKSIPVFLLVLCTTLLLGACRQQRYVYAASKINTPLLAQKGDSRLNGSFSFGNAKGVGDSSRNLGFDLQSAYAIGKNLGIMATYYSRNESDKFDSLDYFPVRGHPFGRSHIRYRRSAVEAGVGYFTKNSKNEVFSIYGGFALGRLRITDDGLRDSLRYARTLSGNTLKLFLQPAYSYVGLSEVHFDLSLRISFLDYNDVKTSYANSELEYLRLNGLERSGMLSFFEPSLTLSFLPVRSANWLRLETSASAVLNSTNRNVRFWNGSLGITLQPTRIFKTKGGL